MNFSLMQIPYGVLGGTFKSVLINNPSPFCYFKQINKNKSHDLNQPLQANLFSVKNLKLNSGNQQSLLAYKKAVKECIH